MSRRQYYDVSDDSLDRESDRRHNEEYYNVDDYEDYYEYEQKKPKTEKEASRVMERAKDKKFWNCDEVDNYNSLEGAVDLMYNKIPGNNYHVKYQENQNGTRLTIFCETCDKTLTSYDPFLSHEDGKNHKKTRQQKLTPPDPNLKEQPKNRRINTPSYLFLEDTLEDEIDRSKRTTIGVHFIYKEVIGKDTYFTCTLCNSRKYNFERISKRKMLSHITGEIHMKTYLEVKHGFVRKPDTSLEEEAKNIEEREGKIHHKIVDFTNQLDEKISKRDIKNIKRQKGASSSSSGSDSSSSRSSSPHRRRKGKRSPSSRRYSPSPSRSIRRNSPSPSRNYRRNSPSPSRNSRRLSPSASIKFKHSPSSRRLSPSPTRSYRPRRSKSLSPLQFQPTQVADASVGVERYELSGRSILDFCKYVENEEIKEESLNTISEDLDMQNLIIHALYVLNDRVDVYYKEYSLMMNDGVISGPLAGISEEMNNLICQLKPGIREE